MNNKTIQVAAIAAVLSGMVITPSFASADGKGITYGSTGTVEFNPGSYSTGPVDPENPDPEKPVDPVVSPNSGTGSPLSIDYASKLDFDAIEISNKNMTYSAKALDLRSDGKSRYVPNYVQISDTRGTNAGWTLTVKQEGQLSNVMTQHKELTGSQIKFVKPIVKGKTEVTPPTATKEITLDPNGAESVIMSAKPTEGAGLWVNYWGTVDEMTGTQGEKIQKNNAISLTILGKIPKDAVKYSTKLTWNLSDVPSNK
ncbi:WxL domain-containing protein [Lysinibacillus sp. CTST325]